MDQGRPGSDCPDLRYKSSSWIERRDFTDSFPRHMSLLNDVSPERRYEGWARPIQQSGNANASRFSAAGRTKDEDGANGGAFRVLRPARPRVT